jgi:phosphoketolase
VIPSDAEAMAAGNVVFGGVIGLGVDAMSGAMNKYPDQVMVAMTPDPACQKPPPLSPRATPRTSNR